MESIKIYEDSHSELVRISKQMGSRSLTIDMDKLDGETKGLLNTVIQDVITRRKHEIEKVILGVQ